MAVVPRPSTSTKRCLARLPLLRHTHCASGRQVLDISASVKSLRGTSRSAPHVKHDFGEIAAYSARSVRVSPCRSWAKIVLQKAKAAHVERRTRADHEGFLSVCPELVAHAPNASPPGLSYGGWEVHGVPDRTLCALAYGPFAVPFGGGCGPFAVPRAVNSREHARTAVHEPQRFRGISRLFTTVRSSNENRGDRI